MKTAIKAIKVIFTIAYIIWACISIKLMCEVRDPVTISGTVIGKFVTGQSRNYPEFSLRPDKHHHKAANRTIGVSWYDYHTYKIGDKFRITTPYNRVFGHPHKTNSFIFVVCSFIFALAIREIDKYEEKYEI